MIAVAIINNVPALIPVVNELIASFKPSRTPETLDTISSPFSTSSLIGSKIGDRNPPPLSSPPLNILKALNPANPTNIVFRISERLNIDKFFLNTPIPSFTALLKDVKILLTVLTNASPPLILLGENNFFIEFTIPSKEIPFILDNFDINLSKTDINPLTPAAKNSNTVLNGFDDCIACSIPSTNLRIAPVTFSSNVINAKNPDPLPEGANALKKDVTIFAAILNKDPKIPKTLPMACPNLTNPACAFSPFNAVKNFSIPLATS